MSKARTKMTQKKAALKKATAKKSAARKSTVKKAVKKAGGAKRSTAKVPAKKQSTKAKSPAPKSKAAKTTPKRKAAASLKRATKKKAKKQVDSGELLSGPGPRMQLILQASIQDWNRDSVNDEEAQLRELMNIPVRNTYDSEEARKRLINRVAAPNKKRLTRKPTPPAASQ